MSFADEEILSLAAEVVRSFEAQAFAPETSSNGLLQHQLPSSITLYRAGRVLYSCYSIGGNDDVRVVALIDAFDIVLATLSRKYVHNVLHNLHFSYASMIISFETSAPSPSSPVISAMRSMIAKPHPAVSISWDDIIEATESLCGIYISSANACQCCCLTLSSEEGTYELELAFVSLSWVYDYLSNKKGGGDAPGGDLMQKSILRTLSRMLLFGVVISSGKSEEDMDGQLSSIMTVIQNIQALSGEYNCALGDMLDLENDFIATVSSKFQAKDASPPPQLQYLLEMLQSSPRSVQVPQPCIVESASILQVESTSQPKPESLADIQIDHIKSVLPALGEGYIEEALKCYTFDVERTLEALLDMSDGGNSNNIHPRLLTIPSNLPRKLRDRVDRYSANVNLHRGSSGKDDGKEHAKIQKEHIKYVERKAEEEAFLIENVSRNLGGLRVSDEAADNDQHGPMRDEYDDDYDDQYDGIGDDGGVAGGIGGLDEGLYDVDIHNVHQKHDRGGAKNEQEMWRKYNTLIKDIDAESRFWESNRNSNRAGGHHGKAKADNEHENDQEEDGDGTKHRGPDKGKGGRLIGPDGKYLPIKRGGQKERGGTMGGSISNPARGSGRGGRGSGGPGGGSDSKGESNANQNKGDGDLSKIQKRRKNDNKSKIGNHHRKDRANKKAAGGMVI
jgi:hypothetical protein